MTSEELLGLLKEGERVIPRPRVNRIDVERDADTGPFHLHEWLWLEGASMTYVSITVGLNIGEDYHRLEEFNSSDGDELSVLKRVLRFMGHFNVQPYREVVHLAEEWARGSRGESLSALERVASGEDWLEEDRDSAAWGKCRGRV